MNRETDTVFLQTLARFIQTQIQLAVLPLVQTINDQANTIAQLSVDKNSIIKELDGAIEGFAAEIARVEKLIPEPVTIKGLDGKDGKDGIDGKDGLNGADGKDGPAGRDGADVVAAFRDSDRHLILTLSNGVTKDVGLIHGRDGVNGADGKDGVNGRDGVDYDQIAFEQDEADPREVNVVHNGKNGLRVGSFVIPGFIDKGVWREGTYKAGDSVSLGGSIYIAQRDTDAKPESGNKDWRLSVKHGRDGKDGKDGKPGPAGKEGERGRDLTQMGFDGKKW